MATQTVNVTLAVDDAGLSVSVVPWSVTLGVSDTIEWVAVGAQITDLAISECKGHKPWWTDFFDPPPPSGGRKISAARKKNPYPTKRTKAYQIDVTFVDPHDSSAIRTVSIDPDMVMDT